jgi:hypothetical protein
MYICEVNSELEEIKYENVYREIIDNPGNEGMKITQINRHHIRKIWDNW